MQKDGCLATPRFVIEIPRRVDEHWLEEFSGKLLEWLLATGHSVYVRQAPTLISEADFDANTKRHHLTFRMGIKDLAEDEVAAVRYIINGSISSPEIDDALTKSMRSPDGST